MGVPLGLGDRGSALWETFGVEPGSAAGAVALEACRCGDRLDELDGMIRGEIEGLSLGQALAEARQQQAVFARLVAAVKELDGEAGGAAPATGGGTPLDELRARRAKAGRGAVAKGACGPKVAVQRR